jgi:hypothetical protein
MSDLFVILCFIVPLVVMIAVLLVDKARRDTRG